MQSKYIGRAKANNIEPFFADILNTLSEIWDTTKYRKLAAIAIDSIEIGEASNQIASDIYTY